MNALSLMEKLDAVEIHSDTIILTLSIVVALFAVLLLAGQGPKDDKVKNR